MTHYTYTALSIDQIQIASLVTIENYLASHFSVVVPTSVSSYEDARDAAELIARYASYKIYLSEIYTKIKARKRLAKQAGLDRVIVEDWLNKEELFLTYIENAKEAHDAIWQMLKTRSLLNEEMRYLHNMT